MGQQVLAMFNRTVTRRWTLTIPPRGVTSQSAQTLHEVSQRAEPASREETGMMWKSWRDRVDLSFRF